MEDFNKRVSELDSSNSFNNNPNVTSSDILASSPLVNIPDISKQPEKYSKSMQNIVELGKCQQELEDLKQKTRLRDGTFIFLTILLTIETVLLFLTIFLNSLTISYTDIKHNIMVDSAHIDNTTLNIIITATIGQITGMFWMVVKYLFKDN